MTLGHHPHRDDRLRALRRLLDAGLAPSEAVAVVRAALRLPGPLDDDLAAALDDLAAAHTERASAFGLAAVRIRLENARHPTPAPKERP